MPVNGQLLVPSKVDITLILNSLSYTDRYINDHQDKYNYVLHKILEGRVFNKLVVEKHGGFTPLNWDTLREVLGQPYCDNVRNDLLAWNVIECDNHFIRGKKSYGYRITQEFASKATLRMVFKETFDAKLQRLSASYKAAKTKSHRLVWKNLNQIGINLKLALAHIEAKYDSQDPEQVDKYNSDLAAIHKIATEDYFIEQPDPESRIYTNLTNLSKDLRPFLYNKKVKAGLVNMDIRNSQPFLFSLLLKEAYGENLPEDVRRYISLTSEGSFYEYMMTALGIPEDEELRRALRSEFKQDFFGKIFYCRTGYSRITDEGKAFAKHFPNVFTLVCKHKEEAYQNLAIKMQRSEARIILKELGQELTKRKIFHATIHDSVVTLEEHAEEVRDLILATFLGKLGIQPTVNKEVFSV